MAQSTILLIEDDPVIRHSGATVLRNEGYRIVEAADGHQGLNLVTNHRFELAIITIRLPDQSGMVLAARIRAQISQPADDSHLCVCQRGCRKARSARSGDRISAEAVRSTRSNRCRLTAVLQLKVATGNAQAPGLRTGALTFNNEVALGLATHKLHDSRVDEPLLLRFAPRRAGGEL